MAIVVLTLTAVGVPVAELAASRHVASRVITPAPPARRGSGATPSPGATPSLVRAAPLTRSAFPAGTLTAVRYGPQAYQLLDVHFPDRGRYPGPEPVIVYLHAGGWISGTRTDVADAAVAQIARGYAVASVDYELATPGGQGSFPQAVYDVKRAIRFIKASAAAWGLDPTRVIVMGESAGGHLAALTGASAGQLEPDVSGSLASVDSTVIAVVDIVGITDLTSFVATPHPWAIPLTDAFLGCPKLANRSGCTPAQLQAASVAPYVQPGVPPIFMGYGGRDTLVVPATQGQPLARVWAEARPGAVVYDLDAVGGHNLSTADLNMAAFDQFIDRAVGGAALGAKRVVLYGDSLGWESRDDFSAALAGAGITQVTTRTFGGTALCDWLAQMHADEATLRPDAVVVEFSGNALTPCMKDGNGQALTGLGYFERYAADASAALDIFAPTGTLVYFAGAPISRRATAAHDPTTAALHTIYATVAASSPLGRYVDAGAAVTDQGRWTLTLPCLGGEPCTGGRDPFGTAFNVVRAPDGTHFCPVGRSSVRGVTGMCPVWSSGAWRYGTAMADPIPLDLVSGRAAA